MQLTFWICSNCGKIHDHKPDYKGNCDSCDSYDLVETSLLQILTDYANRLRMVENHE